MLMQASKLLLGQRHRKGIDKKCSKITITVCP